MKKLFYRLFWKGFVKYYNTQAPTKETLKFAFADSEGLNYYTFTDNDHLPKCRYDKLRDISIYWALRLTPETLHELTDKTREQITISLNAKNDTDRLKALSVANTLMHEIDLRKRDCIPSELFYEMCATYAVREDEQYNVVNESIHAEKIQTLKREFEMGHDFFFKLPNLQRYLNLFLQSNSELKRLLEKSKMEEEKVAAIIGHLTYGLTYGTSGETKETLQPS